MSLVLVIVGVAGLGLGIAFIARYAADLRNAPAPRLQPSVPLISFLVYFATYLCLSALLGIGLSFLGLTGEGAVDTSVKLLLQLACMIGSIALGLVAFRNMTALTREDPAEIGLRFRPVGSKALWGLGAYCAALPLVGVAAIITNWLLDTVFKHIPTPEHPIISDVTQGGVPLILSLVVAVLAAPLVEEIAFRGFLYTALRSGMNVWGAAVLSAVVFAAVHPTIPGEFLPLVALGVVLAIVREKTGSLLPSMVCHATNNLVTLLLVYFYR